MTHRESRGSSGLREPGCLQVCLLPHLWLPSLLVLPPSPVILSVIGTLCAVLFLCSTCSISIALLLCSPFCFYVCLFCSLYFLPIPLPLSLPFGFVFSHAAVDCSASLSFNSGTRGKRTLCLRAPIIKIQKRSLSTLAYIEGRGKALFPSAVSGLSWRGTAIP